MVVSECYRPECGRFLIDARSDFRTRTEEHDLVTVSAGAAPVPFIISGDVLAANNSLVGRALCLRRFSFPKK